MDTGVLYINNYPVQITAVFSRQDVFHAGGADADYRVLAWFTTLNGWLTTSPQIRTLNRNSIRQHTNKLQALQLAKAAGLPVPSTQVTNDFVHIEALNTEGEMIAKPVLGGGYCELVQALLSQTESHAGATASPAIVQPKLPGIDLRIYCLDKTYFGFIIHADTLDYRKTRDNIAI